MHLGALSVVRKYTLNAPRFDFRCWADGGVVHDASDASLYEVTLAAAEVLRILREVGASSTQEISEQLMAGEAMAPGDVALVDELVQQLAAWGAVRLAGHESPSGG
jgi:hypothetical protein